MELYQKYGVYYRPTTNGSLLTEDKIGIMLPCNVIVQETGTGTVEVAAVDPIASMQAIENPELAAIGLEVQAKLKRVVDNL